MQSVTARNVLMELKEAIQPEQSRGLSQMAILQNWLNVPIFSPAGHTLHLLRDAIIVGVDAEWWEWDSELVTELGLSVLDPQRVKDWRSPWPLLREMDIQHVRIKENAHLINATSCKGYPYKFEFGKTTFIDQHVAPFMLRDLFCHHDGHGNLRPVILLGHAIDNDVKMIKDRFGLDIDNLNVVVASIDTQVLAVEAGLIPPGRKIGLLKLLKKFDLEEEYLHNAGNDIVCTMVCALLMAMPHARNSYMKFYKHLKMHLSSNSSQKWGIATFCTRCDSHEHIEENCKENIHCIHCYKCSACTENAFVHTIVKCIRRNRRCLSGSHATLRYAIPCPSCIESSHPERHDEDYAYGHTQEDCPHKEEHRCCGQLECKCGIPRTAKGVNEERLRLVYTGVKDDLAEV